MCLRSSLAAIAALGLTVSLLSDASAVRGGEPDTTFDSVCHVDVTLPPDPANDNKPRDPRECTCVLVAPSIVIVNASCVFEVEDEGLNKSIVEVKFGTDTGGDAVSPVAIEIHRYFDEEGRAKNDLAMMRLQTPVVNVPAIINTDPIPSLSGQTVTIVGFGEVADGSEGDGTSGQRRFITPQVKTVAFDHIIAGVDDVTTCEGDDSAPVFYDFDGDGGDPPKLIAITVGTGSCFANVQRLRADFFASFLLPYIDRFNGPCAQGNGCVTDCSAVDPWNYETPDPDCPENSCAWQGGMSNCNEDCPTRDWDCEVGAFAGQVCEKDGDCEEGGSCIPAADDPTFLYCNRPCDPGGANFAACPLDMTCQEGIAGGTVCAFGSPSRGSQGWDCALAEECRSGICENGACVFACTPGDLCPAGFVCAQSNVVQGTVCKGADPGAGGFCSVTSGGAASSLLTFLAMFAGLLLVFRRRRS